MRTNTKVNGKESLVVHINSLNNHPEVLRVGESLSHVKATIDKVLMCKPARGTPAESYCRRLLKQGVSGDTITTENGNKQ